MSVPSFAILFWYYRSPALCLRRVRELRRLNPGIPIFGLYGGPVEDYPSYKELFDALDDDWCFTEPQDTAWKWRHGDQMLGRWFEARGQLLSWERLVIAQWDLLTCAPLSRYFATLPPDTLYLPGLRPLAPLRMRWWWTRPDTPEGRNFQAFVNHMATRHDYTGPFEACQFLAAALPRTFLAAYARAAPAEPGFLEYKLPAYARALGFTPVDLPELRTAWPGESSTGRIVLTAAKREIDDCDIAAELLRPNGARIFHPVTRHMPAGYTGWAAFVARRLPKLAYRYLRQGLRS